MSKIVKFALIAVLAMAQPCFAQDGAVRRIGVFIGANDGGPERVRLQWAVSDAKRLAEVMQELGGLQVQDTLVLTQPRRSDVIGVLRDYQSKVALSKGSSRRTELVFYYSGHSDELGLRLGRELLTYSELRASINEVRADVSIAILDSCSSGAFTRTKGGVRVQPFLMDETSNMQGYAFLTSSSETEASQESDILGASFFTHYLASGLRGAADTNGDGRITLNEAYYYAFNETLARTEDTRAGPQHPSYDIQLKGSGDLILSDLKMPGTGILFLPDLEGRFFVRDSRGSLVAEFQKAPGIELLLATQPGQYTIRKDGGAVVLESRVIVSTRATTSLGSGAFTSRVALTNRSRGSFDAESQLGNPELNESMGSTGGQEPISQLETSILQSLNKLLVIKESLDSQETILDSPSDSQFLIVTPQPSIQEVVTSNFIEDFGLETISLNLSLVPGLGTVEFGTAQTSTFAMSPLVGWAYRIDGIALGGLGMITEDSVKGVAVSGLFNHIGGGAEGVLLAGLYNKGTGTLKGVQIAGLININDGDVWGTQISGLVNISGGTVNGSQIGVVNYAASMKGIPIGLFSWVQDGIHEVRLSQNSAEDHVSLSFINGTSSWYSKFSTLLDFNTTIFSEEATLENSMVGFLIGRRFNEDGLFFDVELGVSKILQDQDLKIMSDVLAGVRDIPSLGIIPQGSLSVGLNFPFGLGFWFGPQVDIIHPGIAKDSDYFGFYKTEPEYKSMLSSTLEIKFVTTLVGGLSISF